MKVSIITVCKNAAATIEKTIQSVISQGYPEIEHIIIDGNSTDGTLNILDKYRENIAFIISERDTGVYNAMNKGIKRATGDILYFLNANDILYNEKIIEKVVNIFMKKDIQILWGDLIAINEENKQETLQKSDNADKFFWMSQCLCHQVIFYKRELFENYGLYDENYKIAADYDFNLKCLIKNRIKHSYLPEVAAKFTLGGFSTSEVFSGKIKAERKQIISTYFSKRQIKVRDFLHKQCRFLLRNKFFKKFIASII